MTHVNVREVLESLTLAKEAYDAVPDLRRQIDDLQAAVASKDRLIDKVQTELGETIQSKANVEAKLKEVESERDAYGFRAIDAEEKLEKVFGVVRPATPTPSPAVDQGQSEAHPTANTSDSPVDTSTAASTDVSSNTSSVTPEPTGQSAAGPTSTTTGTTEPIAVTEPDPTRGYGGIPFTVAKTPDGSENAHSSSGLGSSVTATGQTDPGDESNVLDKPYLGHPSWEKPHDMAWNEWEAKGGTVPGWMKSHG